MKAVGDRARGACSTPGVELEALVRSLINQFQRLVADLAEHLERPGRDGAVRGRRRSGPAERPRRVGAEHLRRREDRAARAQQRAGPHPEARRDRHARARAAGDLEPDPVAGRRRGRQDAAPVLPARADEGDPEGAGRGRRSRSRRSTSCSKKIEDAGMPEEAQKAAEKELDRLSQDAAAGRRVHRLADLPRLAGARCRGRSRPRTSSTSPRPRRSSTRTTTTWRRSRTGSSSTSRCAR